MPGTILDIKVNAGSKVKKGSVLLILEAMKMENEIVAPCDGSISYINGARGSSINTGDLLAVIQ
jgi:biotin carboxyl carrier protein